MVPLSKETILWFIIPKPIKHVFTVTCRVLGLELVEEFSQIHAGMLRIGMRLLVSDGTVLPMTLPLWSPASTARFGGR
jgi:hypothetical protein